MVLKKANLSWFLILFPLSKSTGFLPAVQKVNLIAFSCSFVEFTYVSLTVTEEVTDFFIILWIVQIGIEGPSWSFRSGIVIQEKEGRGENLSTSPSHTPKFFLFIVLMQWNICYFLVKSLGIYKLYKRQHAAIIKILLSLLKILPCHSKCRVHPNNSKKEVK